MQSIALAVCLVTEMTFQAEVLILSLLKIDFLIASGFGKHQPLNWHQEAEERNFRDAFMSEVDQWLSSDKTMY